MYWLARDEYAYGYYDVKLTINQEIVYDYNHKGYAIGYFGFVYSYSPGPMQGRPIYSVIWGRAPLIIIIS